MARTSQSKKGQKQLQEFFDVVAQAAKDAERESKDHDEVLCSYINTLYFVTNTTFEIVKTVRDHDNHPTFLREMLDVMANIQPSITSLRNMILIRLLDREAQER